MAGSDSASLTGKEDIKERDVVHANGRVDPNAQFGGLEARKALEKKLLRKVDARMLILILAYMMNYLDRNNAGAARLRGFEDDLGLTGQQFPTLLSILYVGYILCQIPSNMFLNYSGKPSLYLPACMIVWGIISCLTGLFVGALLTRFFLGFVEAAFFPGALFLLSKWYKREELGLRTTILYCGNLSSNAFGNLIASGVLSNMQGTLGHSAWRWLFYIEGSLTVVVAISMIFILPDFPSTSTFLSPEERALAELRMEEDAGEADVESKNNALHGFMLAIKDWKVWFLAVALTAQVVALSFNAYFPLMATLGYSRTITLLLCAPPWAFATIVAFLLSRHSDKTNERCFHIIASIVTANIGFIISLATMNTGARFFSLFLQCQMYAGFVVFYAWLPTSLPRPPSKRAVAIALINAFSQLGNVAGSYVWPKAWDPTYRNSYGICVACSGTAIVMCLVFRQHLVSLNKKLDEDDESRDPTAPKHVKYTL
ncbi:MFS general substrate transporter [Exidia glandulosa HHB12029]|uniref:MFS general substrate transporter n=1 Tax=Exidia glandulosa HHB12029 TaxID=1314781 RepID=A0A165QKL9_EXIGL|nr:MFS general substrate transporter [Exidia glandulosa HHB12029]